MITLRLKVLQYRSLTPHFASWQTTKSGIRVSCRSKQSNFVQCLFGSLSGDLIEIGKYLSRLLRAVLSSHRPVCKHLQTHLEIPVIGVGNTNTFLSNGTYFGVWTGFYYVPNRMFDSILAYQMTNWSSILHISSYNWNEVARYVKDYWMLQNLMGVVENGSLYSIINHEYTKNIEVLSLYDPYFYAACADCHTYKLKKDM